MPLCLLLVLGINSTAKQIEPATRPAQVRTDPLGDPLPPQALLRIGTSRLGHADRLDYIAFSADAKVLATAATFTDCSVCVWDATDGRRLFRREFPAGDGPGAIALSSDGKKVAALARSFTVEAHTSLLLWDVSTGEQLLHLPLGRYSKQIAMAFAPDGTNLALGGPDLWLVDLREGKVRKKQPGHKHGVWSVAYHPNKRVVATGGEVVRFWDSQTGEARGSAPQLRGWALSFSPDGATLAVSTGQAVSLAAVIVPEDSTQPVELGPASELGTFKSSVLHSVFSPDGRTLLAGDMVGDCRLYEVATRRVLHRFTKANERVAAVAFPDRRPVALTTGNNASAPRLWDVAASEELFAARRLDRCWVIAFSPDGQILVAAGNDVRFWDARTGKELARSNLDDRVRQLVLTSNGKEIATVGKKVRWWALPGGNQVRTFDVKGNENHGPALFQDGRTLAVPLVEYDGDPFNPIRRVLGIQLIDVEKRQAVGRLDAEQTEVSPSPDGRTLAVFGSGVSFWDLRRKTSIHDWHAHSEVGKVTFSHDGHFAAVSQRDTVTVWEVATRRSAGTWRLPPEAFSSGVTTAFSPDGRFLAAGSLRGPVFLWDIESGNLRSVFRGHAGNIPSLAFRPDGRVLASISADGTILLWDLADHAAPSKSRPLSAVEMDRLWRQLASPEPQYGLEAVARLSAVGADIVGYVAKRLSPMPPLDPKRLASLIADLDSDHFAVRRAAAEELAALGELAEPALRKAREESTSAEVQRQLDRLLISAKGEWLAEDLRGRRALRILERIGSEEAVREIQRIAAGASESQLTQDAKLVLRRLEN